VCSCSFSSVTASLEKEKKTSSKKQKRGSSIVKRKRKVKTTLSQKDSGIEQRAVSSLLKLGGPYKPEKIPD